MYRRAALLLVALTAAACGSIEAGAAPSGNLPRQLPPGAPVAVGGNLVTVMPDSEATFGVIAGLINDARHTVDIEMYEFGRTDLRDALINAHRRGVTVRVIDDPTVDVSVVTVGELRAAGIEVLDYPVRPLMIDHVKLMVVDSRVAVMGGINWGSASNLNHDFDVKLQGPVVDNLIHVFDRDVVTVGSLIPVAPSVADPSIMVLSTLPAAEIRPVALNLIASAHSTIDLDLYVLTDGAIVNALQAAHVRGVNIRLLLDPSQRPSDASAATLSTAGINVRLYRSSGELLHAKVIVTDSSNVLFGSANWSTGGFARNHEIDLEIPNAPAIAADFLAQMKADWTASG